MLNKNVAISLACFVLFSTWSIVTWFWAGGILASSKQTNQSMGCSRYVPIQALSFPKGKNLGDEAALSNPSMRAGETMHLDIETTAQRFQKGIVVMVVDLRLAGGRTAALGPKPAPSANDDTNTSKDSGLAALPKFCAVSKTTPKSAGVAVADDDELLPSPTKSLRRIGIVASTIPIKTPITGGGNRVFTEESNSSFRVAPIDDDNVFSFRSLLLPNRMDRPKLQKKGDQPTRNMDTNPVLRARLSFCAAPFRNRESQKISGTTPAFPNDEHTAVPRASSVFISSGDRKHGNSIFVVNEYSIKDWVTARIGTASELFERPYLVIVLRIDVPKKSGKRIVKVVLLNAFIICALIKPRSIEAIPTPELTTSSSAARVAAWTAGFVAIDATAVAAPISVMVYWFFLAVSRSRKLLITECVLAGYF